MQGSGCNCYYTSGRYTKSIHDGSHEMYVDNQNVHRMAKEQHQETATFLGTAKENAET